jgi:hypothetical protein
LLDREPVCGDWEPKLTTFFGNVAVQADLPKARVDCTIASAIPDTSIPDDSANGLKVGLNLLGNDNITFTGTNFPHELEGNTFELKFDNPDQTNCEVVQTSTTELVCLTSAFNPTADKDKDFNMAIVINGVSVTHSILFKTKNGVSGSEELNPNSASPVLKTPIEITVDSEFPYPLDDRSLFSVNATSVTDSSYIRYLNVLSVNEETRVIRAMFGGAYSGLFQMSIRHKHFGLLNTQGMVLDVSSKVTKVTPQTGSVYGGTLLTIEGSNFGSEITDNPVQISTHGGIGSVDCFVQP